MVEQSPPWKAGYPPQTPTGQTDWDAIDAHSKRNPSGDFRSPEQRREDLELLAKSSEDNRRAEEARLEAAKLKAGVELPPKMAPMGKRPVKVSA